MPGQSEYDAVDIEKQVGQVKQSQTKTQNDHNNNFKNLVNSE